MTDEDFDAALIAAAFAAIARDGWHGLNLATAASEAGLDLPRARARMPNRIALLRGFGTLADRAALAGDDQAGPVQERLFDMVMRRLDVLQAHRAGVATLLRALPTDPASALMLAAESLASMRWLLEAAGVSASLPLGVLRAEGLLAVWLWTLRTWLKDDTADLSATMAALDAALARAAQIARLLPAAPPPPGTAEPSSI